jgi:hypothetical protein
MVVLWDLTDNDGLMINQDGDNFRVCPRVLTIGKLGSGHGGKDPKGTCEGTYAFV